MERIVLEVILAVGVFALIISNWSDQVGS